MVALYCFQDHKLQLLKEHQPDHRYFPPLNNSVTFWGTFSAMIRLQVFQSNFQPAQQVMDPSLVWCFLSFPSVLLMGLVYVTSAAATVHSHCSPCSEEAGPSRIPDDFQSKALESSDSLHIREL